MIDIRWTPQDQPQAAIIIGPWAIKHVLATQAGKASSVGIRQTHGNTIVMGHTLPAATFSAATAAIEGDGILINDVDPRTYHIQTADCLPLVIVHSKKPTWACLLHVGWRGVVGGIIDNAVKQLNDLGCHSSQLQAYGGPCLCPKHMEVEADMRSVFGAQQKIQANCFWPINKHKFLFNIRQAVALQLNAYGVGMDSLSFSPSCTYESHTLPSFRREAKQAGRLYTQIARC